MDKLIVTGRLENWCKDALRNMMWGDLYDGIHQRWGEGTRIRTSNLEAPRDAVHKEGDRVVTLNSVYLLGKEKGNAND